MKRQKLCSIEGCPRDYYLGGYCSVHYNRKMRHGDPLGGRRNVNGDIPKWLEAHVGYQADGCLTWPFSRSADGRAMCKITVGGKTVRNPAAYLLEASGATRPTPKHECAHNCGKGHLGCVNPSHLRWATVLENAHDRKIHGTQVAGERVHSAKLTRESAEAIRKSPLSCGRLSEQYGVHPTTISRIKRGVLWDSGA
jgi:hypothetical protein